MIFFLALAIAMACALLGGFLYFDLSRSQHRSSW